MCTHDKDCKGLKNSCEAGICCKKFEYNKDGHCTPRTSGDMCEHDYQCENDTCARMSSGLGHQEDVHMVCCPYDKKASKWNIIFDDWCGDLEIGTNCNYDNQCKTTCGILGDESNLVCCPKNKNKVEVIEVGVYRDHCAQLDEGAPCIWSEQCKGDMQCWPKEGFERKAAPSSTLGADDGLYVPNIRVCGDGSQERKHKFCADAKAQGLHCSGPGLWYWSTWD